MSKKITWRVRVKRTIEDWIDVQADSPLEAENLVACLPQVVYVFTGSVIRGDRPVGQTIPALGVEDDEDV